MAVPAFRPLAFGEILDGAFTLYRRNLVTFLATAFIPTVAMAVAFGVFGVGVYGAMLAEDPAALGGAMLGGMLLTGVVGLSFLLMWGALTRESSQSYVGQPTSVGDGLRAGLRALPALFGALVVGFIAAMVAIFAFAMLFGIIAALVGSTGSVAATTLFVAVGFVGGAVIYLGLLSMLFAVAPAIVVEGKGPLQAIGRSVDLARGAIGRILGVMVVTILITYLPMLAVMAVTGGFASFMNPEYVPSAGQFVTQQLLALGVGVLTSPFLAAVTVLLYFDRRVRTEALDVRMAADGLADSPAEAPYSVPTY